MSEGRNIYLIIATLILFGIMIFYPFHKGKKEDPDKEDKEDEKNE